MKTKTTQKKKPLSQTYIIARIRELEKLILSQAPSDNWCVGDESLPEEFRPKLAVTKS
jgi:hypothetical protein